MSGLANPLTLLRYIYIFPLWIVQIWVTSILWYNKKMFSTVFYRILRINMIFYSVLWLSMHLTYNLPHYASLFFPPDQYLYIFDWKLSLLEFLINYCGMVTLCGSSFLALNRWSSITRGVKHTVWWMENVKYIYATCLALPLLAHYGFLFTRSSYILESNEYITVYSGEMEIVYDAAIFIHPQVIAPLIDLTLLLVCLILNIGTIIMLRTKWESATKDKQWKTLTIICVADMISHILWSGYDVMGYVSMDNKSLEVWTFAIYPFIDDLDPFIAGWVLIYYNRKIRSAMFRTQSHSVESVSQKPIIVMASSK